MNHHSRTNTENSKPKAVHIRDEIFTDITLCGLLAAKVQLESGLTRATCRNCYRKAAHDLREIEAAREAGEDC